MEITIEEIQKKFETLPEDLKWAIMAADVDGKITEIGRLNGLNVEQMGQLSLETHMVMFGFTHPDKFEASVKGSLGFDQMKTRVLVNAVNEKILKDIREKIMNLHNAEEKKEEAHPEDKSHEEIFKSVGIEVVPKKEEAPKSVSFANQKLTGTFQMQNKTSEYTLNNISKQNETPKTTPSKIDPYREIPE
jgi:hypothetical protein